MVSSDSDFGPDVFRRSAPPKGLANDGNELDSYLDHIDERVQDENKGEGDPENVYDGLWSAGAGGEPVLGEAILHGQIGTLTERCEQQEAEIKYVYIINFAKSSTWTTHIHFRGHT